MEPNNDQNKCTKKHSQTCSEKGLEKGGRVRVFGAYFGSHFLSKIKKCHPKNDPKIDAEKVSKNDAKMMPK